MLEGLEPKPRKNMGPCSLMRRAAEQLDAKDQQILIDALGNKLFSNLNLAEQLTERGFSVSENTVRKHRIGKCSCARKPE